MERLKKHNSKRAEGTSGTGPSPEETASIIAMLEQEEAEEDAMLEQEGAEWNTAEEASKTGVWDALKTEEWLRVWNEKRSAKHEKLAKAWDEKKKNCHPEYRKVEELYDKRKWREHLEQEKVQAKESLKAKDESERLRKIAELKNSISKAFFGLWPETQRSGPPFVKKLLRQLNLDPDRENKDVARDVEARLRRTRTVGFIGTDRSNRLLVLSHWANTIFYQNKKGCGYSDYSRFEEERAQKQRLKDLVAGAVFLNDFSEESKQKALAYAAIYSMQKKWRGLMGVLIEEDCEAVKKWVLPIDKDRPGPPYFVTDFHNYNDFESGDFRPYPFSDGHVNQKKVKEVDNVEAAFKELARKFQSIVVPRLSIYSEFPNWSSAKKHFCEKWYPEDEQWRRKSVQFQGRVTEFKPTPIRPSTSWLLGEEPEEWTIYSKLWPWWPTTINPAPQICMSRPQDFFAITKDLRRVKLIKVIKFVTRYDTDGRKEGQWLNEVFSHPEKMDEALKHFLEDRSSSYHSRNKYSGPSEEAEESIKAAFEQALSSFSGPQNLKALESYLTSVAKKRNAKIEPSKVVIPDELIDPQSDAGIRPAAAKRFPGKQHFVETPSSTGISVSEATQKLELKDTRNLYRWIREGRISVIYADDGRITIPEEELKKLVKERQRKETRATLVKFYAQKNGVTKRAARKWILARESKGLTIKQMAEELGIKRGDS
jgi:hypothetical protein